MIALERMQRRLPRILPGMEYVRYEEIPERLGLFSLRQKNLREDVTEVDRIMSNCTISTLLRS